MELTDKQEMFCREYLIDLNVHIRLTHMPVFMDFLRLSRYLYDPSTQ